MRSPALDVSQKLAALGASGTFATRFSVNADPQLHIKAVGEIALPVSIHTAHQLCAGAQPAQHGYKDQTRLDPRVRDTWEIPAARIRCNSPHWQSVLERALKRIRRDLGLPAGSTLKADLHNMLVYAPGQFFAMHQDSEKADGMLGSLIITLPSRFSGGEFVVSHQGKTLRSRSAASRLGMLAFYADCQHEVRPVTQGYRVVLTYKLIVQGDAQTSAASAQDIAVLAAGVRAFWHAPAAPRWAGDTAIEPPDRLVYLLDHQYTQSGLSWARLKGADAARAAALRRAAEKLDAEIFLALADVHETWTAEDDYHDRHYWNHDDDDDELPNDEADEPALGELIDSDIELRHWISADDRKLALAASRAVAAELCFTRASSECTPFQSEHEGYMGNYGNTVDRWYHRAAVVMWPRDRAFIIRARQSPRWAMAQIAARFQAGDSSEGQALVQRVLPLWSRNIAIEDGSALLKATLPVATAISDPAIAAELLAPFSLQHLAPDMAAPFLHLLDRYGLDWCGARLHQWTTPWQAPDAQLTWLTKSQPTLTRTWSAATLKHGPALAAALLQERWRWLQAHIEQVHKHAAGTARIQALADTSGALHALIRGCRDADQPMLQNEIIASLLAAQLPLQVPLGVLRSAGSDALGLAPVHAHCTQELSARLAQPDRADDDWSITPPPVDASDELGEILARFLRDPAQQCLEWPLAKAKRRHIHHLINHHELPLRHETRRSGRPYTLVLTKTRQLFKRAAAERRQWEKDLARLQKTAARLSPTSTTA